MDECAEQGSSTRFSHTGLIQELKDMLGHKKIIIILMQNHGAIADVPAKKKYSICRKIRN